jgi:hypothetical protein
MLFSGKATFEIGSIIIFLRRLHTLCSGLQANGTENSRGFI